MRVRYLIAAAVMLITGCSTTHYQEPTSGHRARVRFATNGQTTVLRTYQGEGCSGEETEWLRISDGIQLFTSTKRLGMPLLRDNQGAATEIYVDASKPVHGLFDGSNMIGIETHRCGIPFDFQFEDGSDYEVRYSWTNQYCGVQIFKILKDVDGYYLSDPAGDFSSYLDDKNKGCMDAFHKVRLF